MITVQGIFFFQNVAKTHFWRLLNMCTFFSSMYVTFPPVCLFGQSMLSQMNPLHVRPKISCRVSAHSGLEYCPWAADQQLINNRVTFGRMLSMQRSIVKQLVFKYSMSINLTLKVRYRNLRMWLKN